MSKQSLNQLDSRLKNITIEGISLMNQRGDIARTEQEARNINISYIVMSIFFILLRLSDGQSSGYPGLILFIVILVTAIRAIVIGGIQSILATALTASIVGVYNLIFVSLFQGSIQPGSVIMGTVSILFALHYIQRANQLKETEIGLASLQDATLYEDVFDTLSDTQPDNSNTLIELSNLTRKILVWLRPAGVVILIKSEKRLFFDTSHSFELKINGKDTGGDTIGVRARIINKFRNCSISRHGWLRYIRFADTS